MIEAEGRPEVQSAALDVKTAIAIEQALMALPRNHGAEAQVPQVLFAHRWWPACHGDSMRKQSRRCRSITASPRCLLVSATALWYLRGMAMSPSICGVILAAGFSTRMGRDKALLPWPPVAEGTPVGNTFLGATIDLLQPMTDLVIVVAGKNAASIGPVTYAHGAFLVVNHTPELGQFSSIRLGVREVLNHGGDAAFLALTDRPPVLPITLEKLRDAFLNAGPEVWAVLPACPVFRCDGTLWSGDAGADFFYWEIERGIVSREVAEWAHARYKQYKAGRVSEEQICGEMVTMNHGVSCRLLRRAAREFFSEVVSQRVFPEMQELTRRLAAQGCTLWAVSSTNNWLVEHAARQFGIARRHVLAACVQVEEGCASDRLIRVPTDELKVAAIRERIGQPIDVALGDR